VLDFGERLVEIRDRLDVPLPFRVHPWRVFLVASLEGFSLAMIYVLDREFRSSAQDQFGLTQPEPDINPVVEQFQTLIEPATPQQAEQAQAAFYEQMSRRYERLNQERKLWFHAMQAGFFFGVLIGCLLLISGLMCMFSGYERIVPAFLLGFVVLQIGVAYVCIHGWHRA